MEALVPWIEICALTEPHYAKLGELLLAHMVHVHHGQRSIPARLKHHAGASETCVGANFPAVTHTTTYEARSLKQLRAKLSTFASAVNDRP